MNSLEAEYSFLAPTWKLPSIGTPSMYPDTYGTSYPPSAPKRAPKASTKKTTMQNTRYIPPNANRPPHPQMIQQQPGGRPMQFPPSQQPNNEHLHDQHDIPTQFRQNSYPDQRKLNYPPSSQKHVQITDYNPPTPSIDHISERDSTYSAELNQTQQRKPKSNSTHESPQRTDNFKVHEYLYGLSAPNPGSYVSAYKNQRRRLEDDKVNHKAVLNDYKSFVQNGGFGPAFGSADHQTYEEKLDTEKKRKNYSQIVREVNQYKVEEQKRMQNNGGQQRTRTKALPIPKQRRPDVMRSYFLSAQEVREFERRIKREHDANCKCSLHADPHHSSA